MVAFHDAETHPGFRDSDVFWALNPAYAANRLHWSETRCWIEARLTRRFDSIEFSKLPAYTMTLGSSC
jgi:hypothetical protein